MIDRLNNWLIKKYLSSCDELSEFDKERIAYSMNLLLNEFEKIAVIVIFFMLIGKVEVFVLSFVVLMSLRIFIGGIHFLTRCRCLMFTMLFFLTIIVVSQLIIINNNIIKAMIFCFAIISIILFAPLPSKHRILVQEGRKYRLKSCSALVMLIWATFSMFMNEKLTNVVVWTVIMQQFEILFFTIFIKRKELKKHED